MSTHCPECRLNPSRYGPDAPGGPKVLSCPGCPDCADKDQQIVRLKDAAKGIGMVSEMADMEEVAVLVVGLHTEIDRLTAKLDAAHKDVRAFKFALGRIAIYGKDGICPYGCDCPDIASKALTSPSVRKILEET